MSFSQAFLPSPSVSLPLKPHRFPFVSSRPTTTTTLFPRRKTSPPVCKVTSVSDDQLTTLASTHSIVVLKCFAYYCRGCKGVEPKFKKIAAAYQDCIHFVEIDYARYEPFCKDVLGVSQLPFFGLWIDGNYVGGEPMGWMSMAGKLTGKIEHVLKEKEHLVVGGEI